MKETTSLLLALIILSAAFVYAPKPVLGIATKENTWVEKAPMPTARSDLGVAVVNGKIYAIGGTVLVYQDAVRTESKDVGVNEEYDPATNTWTTKKPMPIPSSGFATAVYQNKIFCIGGGVTDFYNVTKGNWDIKLGAGFNQVYDPATDKWENRTSMPIPEINSQANVVNGKIYLLGGHPNTTLNEVYDPTSDNWTLKAPMPQGFYGASSVYSDKIYVLGNHVEGGYFDSNDHYIPSHAMPTTQIYDPASDTWTLKEASGILSGWKSYSTATTGITASKKIYVFYNPTNAPNNILYENQAYDPETGNWENGAGIPTQRNSFAVATVDDLMYVIGGLTITFSIPTVGINPTNPTSVTTIYATVEQYTPFGYGTVPPVIDISSPEFKNYSSGEVFLNFTLNRVVDWVRCSLDGQENVTVTGNSSLSGLTVGLHNVTVYAKDEFGNTGSSQTITFTIAKQEPFPTVLVIVVSAALAAVGIAGVLLVYRRKHNLHHPKPSTKKLATKPISQISNPLARFHWI
jgi:hypothetical protein